MTSVEVPSPAPPLRLLPLGDCSAAGRTLPFPPGGALLFYTDGVTEARNPRHRCYPLPARLRERAGALIELALARPAPAEVRSDPFRIRYRVVPMMDVLFRAQEILFKLSDPSRLNYPDDDELQDLEAVDDPALSS